jgi:hypothetical protein
MTDSHRLVFNRGVVLITHVVLAACSAEIYLKALDLTNFAWWRPTAGVAALIYSLPGVIPYAVSARFSWGVATAPTARVALFLIILVGVSVFVNLMFTGMRPNSVPADSESPWFHWSKVVRGTIDSP